MKREDLPNKDDDRSYASVGRIFPHGLNPVLEEVVVGAVLNLVWFLNPIEVSRKQLHLNIRIENHVAALESQYIRHVNKQLSFFIFKAKKVFVPW
jgi:hypothetical protein